MKINKVKLYNFSSYEGNNEFDFEITDAGKNIVLIGGKNWCATRQENNEK